MPRDPTARQVADMIARYTPEIADAITAMAACLGNGTETMAGATRR